MKSGRLFVGGLVVQSHPTGVRGLKCVVAEGFAGSILSHPTGVRGLKYSRRVLEHRVIVVAPHWDAWIEITDGCIPPDGAASRTPLGCVD